MQSDKGAGAPTLTRGRAETSKLPASSWIARELLVQVGEITQREISSALIAIWDKQLSDLPPEALAAAGDALLKSWRSPYLPTPGDVRAQIENADKKGLALTAATEWERAVHFAKNVWHPDLGLPPNARRPEPVTWHALKAAGGLHYLNDCCGEDLQWARKRFVEYFVSAHETKKVEHLLSDDQAKKLLARVHGALPLAEKKALTPARPQLVEREAPPRGRRDAAPRVELTPEEWDRRRQLEKDKIGRYLDAHPNLTAGATIPAHAEKGGRASREER